MSTTIAALDYDFVRENDRVRKEAELKFRAAIAKAHAEALASSSVPTRFVMTVDNHTTGSIDNIVLTSRRG